MWRTRGVCGLGVQLPQGALEAAQEVSVVTGP